MEKRNDDEYIYGDGDNTKLDIKNEMEMKNNTSSQYINRTKQSSTSHRYKNGCFKLTK